MLAAIFVLTLYANETEAAVKHNVTYIYGDKSVTYQVKHGANAPVPKDTAVPGYTFVSWVGNAANVTEDRVILGAYDKAAVPVVIPEVVQTVPAGTTLYKTPVYVANTTNTNYNPTWSLKVNNNKSAPWPEWWAQLNLPKGVPGVSCAVHWMNGWSGELWKTDIVPYGSSLPNPPDPCIGGMDFAGWEGDWTNVTEDRVIKAWYFEKHKVEFYDTMTGDFIDYEWARDGEKAWVDPPYHSGYKFQHYDRSDGDEYTGNVHDDTKVYTDYRKRR